MTKSRVVTLLLFVFLFSSHASAQQQQPTPPEQPVIADDEVIRVDTTLITVPVSVMDRQGRFIPTLNQSDFQLYDEGVEQRIAFFETADKPFTVALVLDMSESTKFKLKEIQDAANGFLAQLRPADRVIIVAFDKGVYVLAEATSESRRPYSSYWSCTHWRRDESLSGSRFGDGPTVESHLRPQGYRALHRWRRHGQLQLNLSEHLADC